MLMKMIIVTLVFLVVLTEITLEMPVRTRHGVVKSVKQSSHEKEHRSMRHTISTSSPVNMSEDVNKTDLENMKKPRPVQHIIRKNYRKHWDQSKPWKKLTNKLLKLKRQPRKHTTLGKQKVVALMNPTLQNSSTPRSPSCGALHARHAGSLEQFNKHEDSIDEEAYDDPCSRLKQDDEIYPQDSLDLNPNVSNDSDGLHKLKTQIGLPSKFKFNNELDKFEIKIGNNLFPMQLLEKNHTCETCRSKSFDSEKARSKTLTEFATKLNRTTFDNNQINGTGIDKPGSINDLNLFRLNVPDIVRIETKISVKKNANTSNALVNQNDRSTRKYVITNMKVEKDNVIEHLDDMVKQSANKVLLMDKSLLDEYLSKKASTKELKYTESCSYGVVHRYITNWWKLFVFFLMLTIVIFYFGLKCPCQTNQNESEECLDLDENQAQKKKLVRFKTARTSTSPNIMYKTFDSQETTCKQPPQLQQSDCKQYLSQPRTERPRVTEHKKCNHKPKSSILTTSACHYSPRTKQHKPNSSAGSACHCSPRTKQLFNEFKKYEGSLFRDFSEAFSHRKSKFQRKCNEFNRRGRHGDEKNSLLEKINKEEECNEKELDIYNYECFRPSSLKKPTIVNYTTMKRKSKAKKMKRSRSDKRKSKSRKSHSLRRKHCEPKSDFSP